MTSPNKSLGQHWLTDRTVLGSIADAAEIKPTDTVLEIGPGLGTLTSVLLKQADNVVAVEFDEELANKLPGQFPGTNLEIYHKDILSFDLSTLAKDYVVVANVPYYITSKIVHMLMTAKNKPRVAVLLVQKEVAQRIVARPGDMSILAISAQVYAAASLGVMVPRNMFTPAPKVDSQAVILKTFSEPVIKNTDEKAFFRVVKAGFLQKRKKLRSSLAAGLNMQKTEIDQLLVKVGLDPEARAQELSIEQWQMLAKEITS